MASAARGPATMRLPAEHDVLAPDGSEVRILLSAAGGSMAHFLLRPGQISRAVRHRSVDEIWYILTGHGEMWRAFDGAETVTSLMPSLCLTIPCGASFQFRASAETPLAAVAVTMPAWPGEDEAVRVAGKWKPSALS